MTMLEDSTGFIMATPIKTTQSPVVTSSAEAVYVAAAMATREALWLRKLLSALGVVGGVVPIAEVSQSCPALVNNLYLLPNADMPADGLTKSLPSPAFTAFRAAFGVGEHLCAAARGARLCDPLLGEC